MCRRDQVATRSQNCLGPTERQQPPKDEPRWPKPLLGGSASHHHWRPAASTAAVGHSRPRPLGQRWPCGPCARLAPWPFEGDGPGGVTRTSSSPLNERCSEDAFLSTALGGSVPRAPVHPRKPSALLWKHLEPAGGTRNMEIRACGHSRSSHTGRLLQSRRRRRGGVRHHHFLGRPCNLPSWPTREGQRVPQAEPQRGLSLGLAAPGHYLLNTREHPRRGLLRVTVLEVPRVLSPTQVLGNGGGPGGRRVAPTVTRQLPS